MQIEGENFPAAMDTEVSDEINAKHSCLGLNRVTEMMEKSVTKMNIIILAACLDNRFERAWHRFAAQRGLALFTGEGHDAMGQRGLEQRYRLS